MNSKMRSYAQYLITAIVTIIVVFVLCLTLELVLLFKCENYVVKNELNTANLVRFATIEQLDKYLLNEPDNYVVMIKKAKILEDLGEVQDANKLYMKALKISSRSNYTLYSYAMFCAKQNYYAIASSLAEEIPGNTRKNIKYKAEIYKLLADAMYDKKEYMARTKE